MRIARHTNVVAFLCLAAVLCLIELWVVNAVRFLPNADLFALVVTADLVLGIPCLYYLLLVRARRVSGITLLPVFIVALLLARLILPSWSEVYLDRLDYLLPIVEGCALVYGVLKARAIVRHYRYVRPTTVYASDALEASLRHVFGPSLMAKVLMTELSMLAYVVSGWFQRFKNTRPDDVAIGCYRNSGYGAVLSMFIGLIVLETVGLHLLIQHWSPSVAWVLTALSVYSLLWVIGDYHAVRLHPIVLSSDALHLRTGFRWSADIPWIRIASVQRASLGKKHGEDYLNIAVYGEPRLILKLAQPVAVDGLFGRRKHVSRIGITVDDEALFQAEINKRLSSN